VPGVGRWDKALGGQPIEVWCANALLSVATEVAVAEVIGILADDLERSGGAADATTTKQSETSKACMSLAHVPLASEAISCRSYNVTERSYRCTWRDSR
jgi:hypothetical protein